MISRDFLLNSLKPHWLSLISLCKSVCRIILPARLTILRDSGCCLMDALSTYLEAMAISESLFSNIPRNLSISSSETEKSTSQNTEKEAVLHSIPVLTAPPLPFPCVFLSTCIHGYVVLHEVSMFEVVSVEWSSINTILFTIFDVRTYSRSTGKASAILFSSL